MPNVFFISDSHFGHRNLAEKFTQKDGSPARDFDTVEEMDEYMIKQWNSVVRPEDIIYNLGDFVMNKSRLNIAERLNGRKKLIMGNHDNHDSLEYLEYFETIDGVKDFKKHGFVCTHIPVHPCQLEHRWLANVHGHSHHHLIKLENGHIDNRYINLCGEHWDYTPVELSEIKNIVDKL